MSSASYVVNHRDTNMNNTTAELENDDDDDSPCRSVTKGFLARTTIPGISHCHTRPVCVWRLFWMTVTIAGLVIAGFQSRDVINAFLDKSIQQVIAFKMKNELIFPAITVCTNMLVDLHGNQTEIEKEIMTLVQGADDAIVKATDNNNDFTFTSIESEINSFRSKMMNLMVGWSDDRITNTFGNFKFFQDCEWKSRKCNYTDEFYSFSNLRYGKCMTFNAGFTKPFKKAGPDQGFTGILDMNLPSRARVVNSDYAIVLIHPTSFPPVSTLENVIRVHPGERVRIFIQGKSVNYHKVEHINPCVREEEVDKHLNPLFYTNSTPYKHSQQACYAKCRFEKRAVNYHCLDPSLPLHSVKKAYQHSPVKTICNYTDFLADVELSIEDCVCLKNCKEPVVVPVQTTNPLIRVSAKYLQAMQEKEQNKTPMEPFDKMLAGHAVLQVVFASTEYIRVSEEPMYSMADFFGMFGGNLSLWVGVNILCLVEIAEFLILLFFAWFAHMIGIRQLIPSSNNPNTKSPKSVTTQSIANKTNSIELQ